MSARELRKRQDERRLDWAASAISLLLVRSDYFTIKNMPAGDLEIDVVAEKFINGRSERFAIELQYDYGDERGKTRRKRGFAKKVQATTGFDVYFAVVQQMDDGRTLVKTNKFIHDRMLYSEKDFIVLDFPE
jgi:hypothetical protein